MKRLFGTDGIRGVPGEAPLDAPTLVGLGRLFARARPGAGILIGRDTRDSGPELAEAFARGIAGAGGTAVLGGVLPTPAVSLLVAREAFGGGAIISASHNPWTDNGIKLLSEAGEKLSDAEEAGLEKGLTTERAGGIEEDTAGEILRQENRWRERYEELLLAMEGTLSGLRLVVDCAHGAMSELAAKALEHAGATVAATLGSEPNGKNINDGCGSLHPGGLVEAVLREKADLGVAFDGDGDRAILVDSTGNLRDGDDVLYLCATDRHSHGLLPGDTVVGTVMSNVGLETALRSRGIALHRTAVGDRYVLEAMRRNEWILGGEPSGHVIFLDKAVTGDGLMTVMEVGGLLAREAVSLEEACRGWTRCPQVLQNVRVRERVPLDSLPRVREAETRAVTELSGQGRVLLRYSGTEPLLRVMVEGPDEDQVRRLADDISRAAEGSLGTP